jgi:hypothetical protein
VGIRKAKTFHICNSSEKIAYNEVTTLERMMMMKFNKEQLDALVALPDDALWERIVGMAKGYGFNLPKETPPHSDLEKLRGAVNGSKINVTDAIKVLKNYQKK